MWLFGDRIGVPPFENAAMDAIHQRDCDCFQEDFHSSIKIIYNNTTSGRKLRAYVVEFNARIGPNGWLPSERVDLGEFFFEMCRRYGEPRWSTPSKDGPAVWRSLEHNHETVDCKGRKVAPEAKEKQDATKTD